MRKIILFIFCICLIMSISFAQKGAVKAEIKKTDSGYQLLRGGKPYFVNGAGGGRYPERIAAYGGNSIRTWSTRGADRVLDPAQKHGLTVLLGLDVARERHGFNYDNIDSVKTQLEKYVLKC
jgi:hypothetical protein